VLTRRRAIGKRAGYSDSTIGDYIDLAVQLELVEKRREWGSGPEKPMSDVYLRLRCTPDEARERLASAVLPAFKKNGMPRGKHGGSRPRCPDHPDADVRVERATYCSECGRPLGNPKGSIGHGSATGDEDQSVAHDTLDYPVHQHTTPRGLSGASCSPGRADSPKSGVPPTPSTFGGSSRSSTPSEERSAVRTDGIWRPLNLTEERAEEPQPTRNVVGSAESTQSSRTEATAWAQAPP
jgi:hypothetical protein